MFRVGDVDVDIELAPHVRSAENPQNLLHPKRRMARRVDGNGIDEILPISMQYPR